MGKRFSHHTNRENPLTPLSNTSRFANLGAIAQLVEQRTENPCVPGSIPGGTTFLKGVTRKE